MKKKFKKYLCILLTISILLPTSTISATSIENPMESEHLIDLTTLYASDDLISPVFDPATSLILGSLSGAAPVLGVVLAIGGILYLSQNYDVSFSLTNAFKDLGYDYKNATTILTPNSDGSISVSVDNPNLFGMAVSPFYQTNRFPAGSVTTTFNKGYQSFPNISIQKDISVISEPKIYTYTQNGYQVPTLYFNLATLKNAYGDVYFKDHLGGTYNIVAAHMMPYYPLPNGENALSSTQMMLMFEGNCNYYAANGSTSICTSNSFASMPKVIKETGFKFQEGGVYSTSQLLAAFGITYMNSATSLDFRNVYSQSSNATNVQDKFNNQSFAIPHNAIAAANPTWQWDGNNWIDRDTKKPVDLYAGSLVLPNSWNPVTQNPEYSKEQEEAMAGAIAGNPSLPGEGDGSTDAPTTDGTILGTLAALLAALLELPASIAESIKWLIDMILELLQGLFEGVMSLPNLLLDGINSIIQSIISILSNVWAWCSDLPNILADLLQLLIQTLTDLFEWVVEAITSFFSFDWLRELIEQVIGFFQSILDWLNKLGLFLMSLFIPEVDYIHSLLLSLLNQLTDKIPILNQLKNFFSSIFFTDKTTPPNILIDLPEKYGGTSVQVINFEYFAQYRSLLINFIRLFMWFPFLKRIYQKLPDLIVAK